MRSVVFNLRCRSLIRANLLVLSSLLVSFLLAGIPDDHPTVLLILPLGIALYGTFETIRCLQLRWSFYHGGVLLCVYMDLMAVAIIFFLLLYPLFPSISFNH
jgi:hypothetical protein